jgi:hypothetical protein
MTRAEEDLDKLREAVQDKAGVDNTRLLEKFIIACFKVAEENKQ